MHHENSLPITEQSQATMSPLRQSPPQPRPVCKATYEKEESVTTRNLSIKAKDSRIKIKPPFMDNSL